MASFNDIQYCIIVHGSYESIIMLEKCGRLDLTVYFISYEQSAPMAIEKIKTLGAVLELPAK